MSKFKVGDRVRIVDDSGGGKLGNEHVIAKAEEGDYYEFEPNSYVIGLFGKRLELVRAADWRPKVGDRVRYSGKDARYNEQELVGMVGTVRDVYDSGIADVTWDCGEYYNGRYTGGGKYFSNLEPLPVAAQAQPAAVPLKIEAGRYYKTRDGRKVGPMKDESTGFFGAHVDGIYRSFRANGKHDCHIAELDLISLWDEPAVAPATAKVNVAATVDFQAEEYGSGVTAPTPKFKVGDRVRMSVSGYLAAKKGATATVTAMRSDGMFDLRWDRNGLDRNQNDGGYFIGSEFELVANDNAPVATQQEPAPAPKFKVGDVVVGRGAFGTEFRGKITEVDGGDNWLMYRIDDKVWLTKSSVRHIDQPTAIVARIDNGQPRPNPTPYVHTTVESANTEAARLANIHTGKTFGVYVLTGEPAVVEREYKFTWQKMAARNDVPAAVDELSRAAGIARSDAHFAVRNWLAAA